uniref:RING-type domain-containing protein n=1 Tax=Oryza barthii TaxID=65489 RepID=A0A0D3HH41_9ORYZ
MRMTMSDDGDRTCPLCAEDMDITDQQLKPCKCGYEICVWCWHHIIDMAEKEDTEGRCPACRTRYDKDRIVKMAATCDRTVVEKNVDKKQKTQKVKSKAAVTVEAKKHLASVRVIQRNLVYIIGLPANLCNESILERREYFGQYGKVLKVSVSRPTGAPSQQAPTNNSISVYVYVNLMPHVYDVSLMDKHDLLFQVIRYILPSIFLLGILSIDWIHIYYICQRRRGHQVYSSCTQFCFGRESVKVTLYAL